MDVFRTIALLLILALYPFSFAVAQDVSLETVLTKWGEAARNVHTLEAEVTRWHYDHAFDEVTIQRGRFCFKKPNHGRYELDAANKSDTDKITISGRPHRFTKADPILLVWTGGRTLLIEPRKKSYFAWTNNELREARTHIRELHANANANAFQRFFGMLASWPVWCASPPEFLPLLVTRDPTEFKDRFELAVAQEDYVSITAVPKRPEDKARFRKIIVLVDARTNLPFASQLLDPSGHTETVHLFENIRLNQHPDDHDALLDLRLDGFRQINKDDDN
jgi:outer membrane lipoprotein-sorting protein